MDVGCCEVWGVLVVCVGGGLLVCCEVWWVGCGVLCGVGGVGVL